MKHKPKPKPKGDESNEPGMKIPPWMHDKKKDEKKKDPKKK